MKPTTPDLNANSNRWVIVIQGPTAVGKTEVALHLAEKLDTVILSADSRQCYRELTIGTAKPTPEQLAKVTHGFIDSHSIHQPVSAADFELEGLDFLQGTFRHQPSAVVVGGSGLYLRALLKGMDPVPPPKPEIREALQAELEQAGTAALAEKLFQNDPDAYEQIDTANPARILRALEVYFSTGVSITHYWQYAQPAERPFRILPVTLNLARSQLHERINTRCDQMLKDGLLTEVENLYPFRHYTVLQTVGYQEFFDYLEGCIGYAEAVRQFKAHTRQFAKRQLTWFRRDTDAQWFEPHQLASITDYIHQQTGWLSTSTGAQPFI